MNCKTYTLIASALVAGSLSLSAQGGFVLFGESGPTLAPEEKTVRPLTAPYFHEDSFITTDIRAWWLRHHFYNDTIGGRVTVSALQARLALTQSLQLVAYKDGYTNFSGTLGNESGWNDIGAGLKWAFLQDWSRALHAAAGLGYEFSLGDQEVLQNTDTPRMWGSINKAFDRLHLGATANYLIANNRTAGMLGNADMITLHFHADYFINQWFSPVVEVNAYFVTDEGPGVVPFSGVDAVSIGGGENEDTYTLALGGEFRPFPQGPAFRGAYETQLSNNVSLFGHRWTVSAVYEF